MSDEPSDPDAGVNVFDLIEWAATLSPPLALREVAALRAEVEGGHTTLTAREQALVATLGLIVGHAAHDHARQMFIAEMPKMLATIARRLRDDDDDSGGSVQ
jgi:hypothetical protein